MTSLLPHAGLTAPMRQPMLLAMDTLADSVFNTVGETVAFGPLRHNLFPLYLRWSNDFDVLRTLGPLLPVPAEAIDAWYEHQRTDEHSVCFTLYKRSSLRPIGAANLHTIDHARRTATFAISIGEPECWGRGYGTEATRLMLDYDFTALGLHNIMLTVLGHNKGGIHAYTRAGVREIGRRRETYPFAGQVYDIVMMDCLATEFESPVLRARLSDGALQQRD